MIRQAVILCGGKGTRLGERARDLPKPLIPVGGKPVLDYIMDVLQRAGITRYILAAGYLGEMIVKHYEKNPRAGCGIQVMVEPSPLGTAGAVKLAAHQLDDDFVLAYGDVFTDFDLSPMLASHAIHKPTGTLMVRASDHPWDSHLIEQTSKGEIRKFIYQHEPGKRYQNVANAAFYILNKKILPYIPGDKPSDFGSDVFPSVLRQGGHLRTFELPSEGFVKDMGTADRLAEVEQYLREKELARKAQAGPSIIKTVLVDRDGVLNVDHDLIDRPERLQMLEGSAQAIFLLNRRGIKCHVITNQPVIARGLCSEKTLNDIHDKLRDEIAKVGGSLESIYYCPHHPETHHAEGVTELRRGCRCRKPSPGLIFQAQREHGFDLAGTLFVGDRATDVRAGRAAGIRTILVGAQVQRKKESSLVKPSAEFPSLLAFAEAVTTNPGFL